MLSRRSLLAGTGAWLGAACAPPTVGVKSHPDASPVHLLGQEFEELMGEHGLLEWSRYVGAETPGNEQKMASLRARERDTIVSLALACSKEADRLEPREVELWLRADRGFRLLGDPRSSTLADRLERLHHDFPLEVDGKSVTRLQLRTMSASDDPSERRAANRAWGGLQRQAAPIARDLFRRRRELAKELSLRGGFYPALLELRGVSLDRLRVLLGQLDERTRPAFIDVMVSAHKAAARSVSSVDLEWLLLKLGSLHDHAFPAEKALPLARTLWSSLGVDLEHPRIQIDVREFAFSGQTISLHVPDDVRTVVHPSPGARFYSTLMHELGHAFAATRNRETRPVFKGYEWVPGLSESACDEGIAEVFGRLLEEPAVLEHHIPTLSVEERASFLQTRKNRELVTLRVRLLSIAFERLALEDPEQDLDSLWRRLHHDLLGLEDPTDVEPTWATSPFLATYPVYLQSYLLAAMFSCQIRTSLRSRLGRDWISPVVGNQLASGLVADGARTRMDEKLRRVTGTALSVDAYATWLTEG